MYITAMWLRPPRKDRGVNIYIHKHPDGLPFGGDIAKISQDPGPDERSLRRIEARPGGNRVEAYLDIAVEDKDYSLERLETALDQVREILDLGTMENPLQIDVPLENGRRICLRFSVSDSMAGPESKRRIFALLRGTLRVWLKERLTKAA